MKLKTIGLISLGCSKNLNDSEVMAGLLLQGGYKLAPTPDVADVIWINTCAFIEPARAEAAENIMAACEHKANGNCKAVVVTGCMPQRYREQMFDAFPDVDAILGVDELDNLPSVLKALEKRGCGPEVEPLPVTIAPGLPVRTFNKPMPALRLTGQVFAYVKISEGCNHACAYCAIPQFRGRLRSRSMEDILSEIRELLETGTREINLIAQDVTAYGMDLRDGKSSLAALLREIDAFEGIFWVRFLYGFHNHVTDELLEVMAGSKHILPYFDLPIQHSVPSILKAMYRADTVAAIDTFPERLRQAVPGAVLRTTCMVGFPGETEEDFKALCDYIRRVRFDHMGSFVFSPEEGTKAAEMDGRPDDEIGERRRAELMAIQHDIAAEKNHDRIGLESDALVVDYDDGEGVYVRLPHQAPEVDGVTHVLQAPEDIVPGDFVRVRVTDVEEYDLVAELI